MSKATKISRRATQLAVEGRAAEAFDALEEGLRVALRDDDSESIRLLFGQLCVQADGMNRTQELVEWSRMAFDRLPDDARVAYVLASALLTSGNREEAHRFVKLAKEAAERTSDIETLELIQSHPVFGPPRH